MPWIYWAIKCIGFSSWTSWMLVIEFLLDPFLISLLICLGFLYIITWEYRNYGTDADTVLATDSTGQRMHQVRSPLRLYTLDNNHFTRLYTYRPRFMHVGLVVNWGVTNSIQPCIVYIRLREPKFGLRIESIWGDDKRWIELKFLRV